MFGILQAILVAMSFFIGVILIVAALKPKTATTARFIDIKAPPERIFPHIDSLRSMNVWNPFVKTDPNIRGTYSGPEHGVGASYDFDGNKNAGAGHITIKESVPSSRVRLNLVMTRPFACDNTVEFRLVPKGDITTVTWAMTGPAPYFMRVIGTLFKMEKMVTGSFDLGLAGLKAIVEGAEGIAENA